MHSALSKKFLFIYLCTLTHGSDLLRSILGPSQSDEVTVQIAPRFVPFFTSYYETIYYDLRCIDQPALTSGPCTGPTECKQRCSVDAQCGYLAYWKNKHCETYVTCDKTTNKDQMGRTLKNVQIFKRLSECDYELKENGPYMKEILKQFPRNMVRIRPPFQNIHCFCISPRWGVCAFIVGEGTEFERLAKRKLNRDSPELPFKLLPVMDARVAPVVFHIPKPGSNGDEGVFTEMLVLTQRKCIHITLCTDGTPNGVCPVTRKPFMPGDPVHILKTDETLAAERQVVHCISANGIRSLAMTMNIDYDRQSVEVMYQPFQDPNLQETKTFQDYQMYFLVDDALIQSGMCRTPLPHEERPSSPASQHSGSGSSSLRSTSSSGGKSHGKKKGKKGKSKLRYSGGGPSGSYDAASPPIDEEVNDELIERPESPEIDDPYAYIRQYTHFSAGGATGLIGEGSSPLSDDSIKRGIVTSPSSGGMVYEINTSGQAGPSSPSVLSESNEEGGIPRMDSDSSVLFNTGGIGLPPSPMLLPVQMSLQGGISSITIGGVVVEEDPSPIQPGSPDIDDPASSQDPYPEESQISSSLSHFSFFTTMLLLIIFFIFSSMTFYIILTSTFYETERNLYVAFEEFNL